nr:hypothetical protein [Micromonospora sp. DSM 115978]
MIAAFAAEWILLRRRRFFLGTLAAVCGVAALGTVLTFMSVGSTDFDGVPVTAEGLAAPSGLVAGLESVSILLGVVALSVVAAVIAGGHSHGTLRNALAAQPHRLRLLGGTSAALASFVVVMVAAATAVAVALAFPMAELRGVAVGDWVSFAGVRELGLGFVNVAVSSLGYGLLGAALAVVLRSPAIAISVGLAYVLPIEELVARIYAPAAEWMPGQLLGSIAAGGSGYELGYGDAGIRLLCYGAVAVVISAVVFRRRDVTA